MDIKCCENLDKFIKKEEVIENCNTVYDLKEKYPIKSNSLILRLLILKGVILSATSKDINYDELLGILDSEINNDNIELPLEEKLDKFLKTQTNKDVLNLYKQKTIGIK